MKLATRMSRLGTETAFETLAKAKALEAQGHDIIHLEIGQPDFDTPANIVAAGIRALEEGHTRYTAANGLLELREVIAAEVSRTRHIDVQPEQVVVVPGGKPIIFYTLLALCEAGDEVIYPNPGFPIYESMINFVGAKPVPLPLLMERSFSFDPEQFLHSLSDRTRLIILNSPQNPTGGVLTAADLELVAEVARSRDIPVLSDEIYSRILYEDEFRSIASLPGMAARTIILDGFSKSYAMTGWRAGYGVMPVELAQHMTKLMVNSNSCTADFTQRAGIEALVGPQDSVEAMVAAFRRRRDVVVEGLNEIPGFRCLAPQGAFYAFPHVAEFGLSSTELADYLLERAGVATLAGSSFGEYGEGFLRLSYANSEANLRLALERIKAAVERL
ncbi:MAG: pyridoxal phosphate-dependent aminotransferase [Chloroflexi bacterium]|nr:pyridoxal phosphate-dependent aminotransferase [Chloroflexota bacterium]